MRKSLAYEKYTLYLPSIRLSWRGVYALNHSLISVHRILSRKIYKGEIEQKWPGPEAIFDWDMWMRTDDIIKGRECIIPDISRTYHFGSKGMNVGSFMQAIYFKKHALNKVPDVKLDVSIMDKENYEKEIKRRIRYEQRLMMLIDDEDIITDHCGDVDHDDN